MLRGYLEHVTAFIETKVEGREQNHKLDNIGESTKEKIIQKAKWKHIREKCPQMYRDSRCWD